MLQCDSSRICRIIGVVRKSGGGTDIRAIVMIERGHSKGAMAAVRMAFVDDDGFAVALRPTDGWRLYASGVERTPTPVPLGPLALDADKAFGLGARQSHDVVSALSRWPASLIANHGTLIARMPKGDLRKLFQTMNKIQHPKKGLTVEEEAQWMRKYHYSVVRAKPAAEIAAPDSISLACDTRTYTISQEAWWLDKGYLLWFVKCPEGTKLFTQVEGEEPKETKLIDDKGKPRKVSDAVFDPDTSTFTLIMPKKHRWDCGRQLRYGYTRDQGFGTIEDRQLTLCRGIAPQYWPLVWSPNSWKLID